MRVVLEFDGDTTEDLKRFERALCENDENFSLIDSILWELDYGEGESKHATKYGTIIIKQQM